MDFYWGLMLRSAAPDEGETRNTAVPPTDPSLSLDRRNGNTTQLGGAEVAAMSRAASVNLGHNLLAALPGEFRDLCHLRELTLDHNNFTAFPEALLALPCLENLDMSYNNLLHLPEEIGRMMQLKKLMISSNLLKGLPESIGDLITLEYLDFSENSITAFPSSFGNLARLAIVVMHHNKVNQLPSFVTALPMLTVINLEENEITSVQVPESAADLSLCTLNLSHNRLTTLCPLQVFSTLEYLHLDGNGFTTIPLTVLHLTSLSYLSMVGNYISEIPPSISNLTRLQHLDLSYNDLTATPLELSKMSCEIKLTGNKVASALPPNCILKTKCPADQIIPHLWLGSIAAAKNRNFLVENNVTHIVSVVARNYNHSWYPHLCKYLVIEADDEPETDLLSKFSSCHQFIDEGLSQGSSVLVHCAVGASRSATVVISFLMKKLNLPMAEALAMVQTARPCVSPNYGFMEQLTTFETTMTSPPSGCTWVPAKKKS
ncbi:Leucine-rich repeat protein SHOC-2 [Pelomyxa schiedti]|nr:Leucine-rich repeat protein SHOC-2 [Pelomyxa schiedti]